MVNRQLGRGSPVRTPRKSKNWAYAMINHPITGTNSGSLDLLAEYRSDIGVNETRDITVMRIIGTIWLEEILGASSPAYVRVRLGFIWLDRNVTAVNMEPWEKGIREAEWIQLGSIEGEERSSPLMGRPANAAPIDANHWTVDITQMRKQPTPAHRLSLVYWTNGLQENGTFQITTQLGFFLALP